jgi:hypothetical protein
MASLLQNVQNFLAGLGSKIVPNNQPTLVLNTGTGLATLQQANGLGGYNTWTGSTSVQSNIQNVNQNINQATAPNLAPGVTNFVAGGGSYYYGSGGGGGGSSGSTSNISGISGTSATQNILQNLNQSHSNVLQNINQSLPDYYSPSFSGSVVGSNVLSGQNLETGYIVNNQKVGSIDANGNYTYSGNPSGQNVSVKGTNVNTGKSLGTSNVTLPSNYTLTFGNANAPSSVVNITPTSLETENYTYINQPSSSVGTGLLTTIKNPYLFPKIDINFENALGKSVLNKIPYAVPGIELLYEGSENVVKGFMDIGISAGERAGILYDLITGKNIKGITTQIGLPAYYNSNEVITKNLLADPNVQTAITTTALIGLPAISEVVGGASAGLTARYLESLGVAGYQTYQTIKNPTPTNIAGEILATTALVLTGYAKTTENYLTPESAFIGKNQVVRMGGAGEDIQTQIKTDFISVTKVPKFFGGFKEFEGTDTAITTFKNAEGYQFGKTTINGIVAQNKGIIINPSDELDIDWGDIKISKTNEVSIAKEVLGANGKPYIEQINLGDISTQYLKDMDKGIYLPESGASFTSLPGGEDLSFTKYLNNPSSGSFIGSQTNIGENPVIIRGGSYSVANGIRGNYLGNFEGAIIRSDIPIEGLRESLGFVKTSYNPSSDEFLNSLYSEDLNAKVQFPGEGGKVASSTLKSIQSEIPLLKSPAVYSPQISKSDFYGLGTYERTSEYSTSITSARTINIMQISDPLIKTLTNQSDIQLSKQFQNQITNQVLKENLSEVNIEDQILDLGNKSIETQIETQIQHQVQNQIQTQINIWDIAIPGFKPGNPKSPVINLLSAKTNTGSKIKRERLYIAYRKSRGKYIEEGLGTESQLLLKESLYLPRTLSRTFKVKATNQFADIPVNDIDFRPSSNFRSYRIKNKKAIPLNNTFILRKGLQTRSAVNLIQSAKREKKLLGY